MILRQLVDRAAERAGGELPLPAGNAAGALNELNPAAIEAQAVALLRNSPAGFVTLGSLTLHGNQGNAIKFRDPNTDELARDWYHDTRTGSSVNSIGLKSPPAEAYLQVVSNVRKVADDMGKLLITSVSSSGEEDPSVVLPELAERALEAGTHVVEINLGCPNKVESSGRRHPVTGLDLEATEIVIDSTTLRIGYDQALAVKLSYYEDFEVLHKICNVVQSNHGVDAVVLTNTEPNVLQLLDDGTPALDRIPGHAGGGSGPIRSKAAYRQLVSARHYLPTSIDIISTTGVYTGAEVLRRERAGAVLSGMVSRLWVGAEQGYSYAQSMRQVHEEYLNARLVGTE